ncbi:MAG: alpha/beta hydrolase [Bacteroidales bacterium]|nr:alpha/beta hydrolase [Bacteroidales bacterium]MDD4216490.1 alpha/beta hydrolase [Bacteroidales bacterium]MDY0141479.1 alpha/beta hydrolase [Bacteroidales bacterium]
MKSKNTIAIGLCLISFCLFVQCKTNENTTASKKSQSIYNILKLINFSDKKSDKVLTDPKRGKKHFSANRFDKDLIITEHKINDFKALTITTKNISKAHIIFFHGGAYFIEASKAHRKLIEKICLTTDYKITYIDYPLAPENDAITTHKITYEFYQILLKKHPNDEFILMGDSAGGGLALAFLQSLVTNNEKTIPQKTILLSPWLDVGMKNPDIKNYIDKDVVLNCQRLIKCGKIYARDLDTENPLVSPIYGELNNLGTIKIFVSTHELFYPDCLKLDSLISEASGSICETKVMEGMVHDWILFPFDESENCIKEIIESIEK